MRDILSTVLYIKQKLAHLFFRRHPEGVQGAASLAAPSGRVGRIAHPLFGVAPIRATTWRRPEDDEAATAQTVAAMAEFIRQDACHPLIRQATYEAVGALRGDPAADVAAVFRWIKRRVRFIEDRELARLGGFPAPDQAEVLVRPVDLLTMPQPAGDCDCQAMLGAAMLRALGIDSELVTIAADPGDRSRYSHVYLAAILPGGARVPLDLSHGRYPGWAARTLGKVRTWSINMPQSLKGLGFDLPTAAGNGSLGIDWAAILQTGVETGAKIATAQWGQPPAGTYTQTGPQGSVYYRQPEGTSAALQFPTTQISGNWVTVAVIAALGLVLILALRGR